VRDEPDDTELTEELRRAVADLDAIPAPVVQAAVGSYSWRTVDAEFAELVFDSLVDQGSGTVVRGPQEGRLLSFEAADLTIDVEVGRTGSTRTLIGQILPPQPAKVELRQGDEVTALDADELGRFESGPLGPGPLRLRCSIAAGSTGTGSTGTGSTGTGSTGTGSTGTGPGRRVATEWVSI
jgi:hypothetical protein